MSGGEAAAVTKFVTTAVTTVLKLWRWRHPDTNSVVLRGWADKLAKSVQRDESTRLAQLGVDIGAEIRLSFDVDGARTSRHSATKIGEFYRSVPTRRLAVLGGPGAGKTVTIIQLLLDSIAHRLDHRDPVPVRVNCSRWDSQHTDIDECLIKVLTVDYHCNATIATALVRSGYNLPLFDGLDEIDPVGHVPREARQLLDELNEPPWRSRPVIVVCRTDTYRNARGLRPGGDAGLHAATTVVLRDLTTDEVVKYFEQYQQTTGIAATEWAPVTTELTTQPDGSLAAALRTPWLLTLTMAYLTDRGHAGAAEIVHAANSDTLKQTLFASLIPSAVKGLPGRKHRRRYHPQRVHHWLRSLALTCQQVRGRHGRDIALDEIWRLSAWRCRILHSLLAGVVLVSMFGTAGWFASRIPHLMPWGLPVSAAGALAIGLVSGLPRHVTARRTLLSGIFTDPRRWLLSFGLSTPIGVFSALINGVTAARISGPTSGSIIAVVNLFGATSVIGIILRLTFFPSPNRPRLDEQAVIRDDLRLGSTLAVILFVPMAIVVALLYRLMFHVPAVMLTRLIPGFVVGAFAIALYVSAASMRYLCAKAVFALNSAFSASPAAFLKWAREAGLLRITGEAYQFRHNTFHQWLLDHPTAPETGVSISTHYTPVQEPLPEVRGIQDNVAF